MVDGVLLLFSIIVMGTDAKADVLVFLQTGRTTEEHHHPMALMVLEEVVCLNFMEKALAVEEVEIPTFV